MIWVLLSHDIDFWFYPVCATSIFHKLKLTSACEFPKTVLCGILKKILHWDRGKWNSTNFFQIATLQNIRNFSIYLWIAYSWMIEIRRKFFDVHFQQHVGPQLGLPTAHWRTPTPCWRQWIRQCPGKMSNKQHKNKRKKDAQHKIGSALFLDVTPERPSFIIFQKSALWNSSMRNFCWFPCACICIVSTKGLWKKSHKPGVWHFLRSRVSAVKFNIFDLLFYCSL